MAIENNKKNYLLSKAVSIPGFSLQSHLKIVSSDVKLLKTANHDNIIITQSKTFAEPSDDDPDVEAEFCY